MSVARRPLLTAAAAGSLLCALWFVPSANATADRDSVPPDRPRSGASASASSTISSASTPASLPASVPLSAPTSMADSGEDGAVRDAGAAGDAPAASHSGDPEDIRTGDGFGVSPRGEAQGLRLADTGSVDTTPYLVGGTLFLVVGAGFVSHAARRSGSRTV
ncbi:hypothetical protein [Streptomyces pacificus]|uniref:LPXTG cell wall anchor domain-containing protein n=1 Tax=Streptomyces pacificus TaxID=2705029 RepID=A0A6A0AWJ0_9ACTN|nr:hypothetical protein [Streptomyces pacificus]GFH35947.1 hypothetical protein SCWH03_21690 [Streptomyces pacificus]